MSQTAELVQRGHRLGENIGAAVAASDVEGVAIRRHRSLLPAGHAAFVGDAAPCTARPRRVADRADAQSLEAAGHMHDLAMVRVRRPPEWRDRVGGPLPPS